jgi:DNA-binding IclR family transcriptional regulator
LITMNGITTIPQAVNSAPVGPSLRPNGLAASPDRNSSEGVRAVERALALLFRLAASPHGVGLQQLARDVGCSKSTVHRLLTTLQAVGVAQQDARSRLYQPGPRLAELTPAPQEADLRRLALPIMRQLRDETEETVTLHVIQNDSHVVVEQVESEHEIRRILPIGQPVPLRTGATARAILAFLPEHEAAAILARTRRPGEPGPPAGELRRVRERGYSLSPGERIAGGTAMSAPVFDASGRLCAALSVSGPRFRFSLARAARSGPALAAAARRLSLALGRPPGEECQPAPGFGPGSP